MEAEASQFLWVTVYLLAGFLFWQIVVRTGLELGAEDGNAEDVDLLEADRLLPLHMILVKALVVLTWPMFLTFGIASRYLTPDAATERN